MKNKLLYIVFAFALTSCVSKGKYNALRKQHDETVNQKGDLENVLAKMAMANDSLKARTTLLDSLLIAEKLKNGMGAPAPVVESSAKTKVTISKAVEYDTKAVYICNIPNYVFWPKDHNAEKFLIGIIGDSKLNASLGAQLYEKKIQRLPAIVEPYSPAPGKKYHMLFFAESKQNEFYKLKKELQNQPVLLIVESANLEKAGAHIFVYAEGDKVKFRVNKKQIEKAGLSVSESLVKLGLSTQ